MKKIAIMIAVVLCCVVIATAAAVIAHYPLQQTADPNSSLNTNPPAKSQPAANQTFDDPNGYTGGATVQLSSLFDAELTYAQVGISNSTGTSHDHFGFGIESHFTKLYAAEVSFRLTYLGNPENEPWDVKFEGYRVNFTSDTGVTKSYLGWYGTNYALSENMPNRFPDVPDAVQARLNMALNQTIVVPLNHGDYGNSSSAGLWAQGTPNTVTVTVQRAGWVTTNGSTVTNFVNPAAGEIIQQIQLEKSGDRFVFGTAPPK
jgi:hypothetical protein